MAAKEQICTGPVLLPVRELAGPGMDRATLRIPVKERPNVRLQ